MEGTQEGWRTEARRRSLVGRAQKLNASLERDPGSIPAIASFMKEKFIS